MTGSCLSSLRPTRRATALACVLWLSSIAGCESSKPVPAPPPVTIDFERDGEESSGAAVYLKGRLEDDRVIVDVLAREVSDVHGLAFRLRWDPSKLALVEARASEAWSRQALLLAKEGLPGELAVAWTEKGAGAGIDAREDTRLGRITFTLRTNEEADLAFRPDRSMLVDSKGTTIPVAWRGGRVAARMDTGR